MGNRGCLHDAEKQIRRQWTGRRWIICLLGYNERHRTVMAPGKYTELFFLDEATALAAGHRPCFECRHANARRFAGIWRSATGRDNDADAIDNVLHAERRLSNVSRSAPPREFAASLPDGAIVERDEMDGYWLVAFGRFWRWTPSGYDASATIDGAPVQLVTPPATIAVIASGYRPQWHPSIMW